MKKQFMILLSCVVFTTTSYANCDAIGCTSTIKRVYPTALSKGVVYLELNTKVPSTLRCTLAENRFFALKKNHPLFKETYALALTSYLAQKVVRIRIRENTNDCEVLYMTTL